MAVVFDPHQNLPGNNITGEPGTVIGTKYRMLVPKNGPFYTGTLVVRSGGKVLSLADDYVITHPYMTSMQHTGRSTHGMIWIVNPKITTGITLDYHAVGIGKGTDAQVSAERARNADTYPSNCQWEQVIGDVYFPPVDIQFDWDNWKGERELMQAIAAVGAKMTQAVSLPNPLTQFSGTLEVRSWSNIIPPDQLWKYDGHGNYTYLGNAPSGINISWKTKDGKVGYSDYALDFYTEKPSFIGNTGNYFNLLAASMPGTTYLEVAVRQEQVLLYMTLNIGTTSRKYGKVIFGNITQADLDKGYRIIVKRSADYKTVDIRFVTGNTDATFTFDVDAGVPEFAEAYKTRDVASQLKRPLSISLDFDQVVGSGFTLLESPGALPGTVSDNTFNVLQDYHNLVDALYRNSPAITHVKDTNNPHKDESYGRIRAIQRDGIASDSTLASGLTQPQLADYVNSRSAKASDFSDKMLRTGAPRTITGTFRMLPGLSSVTSSVDEEAGGVGTNLQVDDKVVRLLARTSGSVQAGNNPITFEAGSNSLVLYPDARGLQWNGKPILDPTTVGKYLPGNSGGADGVFYGSNSDTVTMTGNGIETQPFICTWVPPSDKSPSTLALRMLANDFGTSDTLAATPALIQKLADLFTGKLSKSTAYINGMSLASSVSLDRTSFNLNQVSNVSDLNMPVSDPQAAAIGDYSLIGHKHPASAFGIGNATTAKVGIVKFGGLVDDATLALDGSYVIDQLKTVARIEQATGASDTNSVISILRYGSSGSAILYDAVTINGWMLTLKANNYFAGQDYAVPLATFNIAELFPSNYEDAEFGIYVDIVDSKGVYLIMDSINGGETDTATRIGTIKTDDGSITSAVVQNVTRLGDFSEFTNHENDVNAHVARAATMADVGIPSAGLYGINLDGGVISVKRGMRDMRVWDATQPVSGESVDSDAFQTYDDPIPSRPKMSYYFKPLGSTLTSLRRLLTTTGAFNVGGMVVTVTSAEADPEGVIEFVLAHFYQNGKLYVISMLVNPKGFYSPTVGNTYVAMAINHGDPNGSAIIPLDEAKMLSPMTLNALGLSFNRMVTIRDTSAQRTVNLGTNVAINGTTITFSIAFDGKDITLTTKLDSGAGKTQSLKRYTDPLGMDVVDIANNRAITFNTGIGCYSTGNIKFSTIQAGSYNPVPSYVTATNLMDYLQPFAGMRVLDSGTVLSNVKDGVVNVVKADIAKFTQKGMLPMFNNPNSVVYMPGLYEPCSIVVK